MPTLHRHGSFLSEVSSPREEEPNDFEFVEVDPTGRYGRYKEVLGKGAFKTVYRAFDQEDGIEVAWNQVQVQNVAQTPEDLDRLYSEVHLLKTLKHKNIIKFYHSWVDKRANNINFITEIFTSGTLRQFRKRHKHVEIKAVKKWSRQILRGLLYLHSHDPPIIHRDLKCDNIFINGNQGEVKIGDLGLATILHHAYAARSVIGTPEFMAPELYEEEYTELVDIYSFGMCLLEMVTSEYPYSECTNAAQIFKKVTSGKKPEALKKVKDPELCQFIEKCLAPASNRLPARELLMDPFLQCEESTAFVESTPYLGRMASDMDDSVEFSESSSHGTSATVQISYKLKETLSPNLNEYGDCVASIEELKASPVGHLKATSSVGDELCNANSRKHVPVVNSKEDRARSVDFRVRGKRREDDMVFLKLRIADAEGKVSNIHFPFDVESDTAMCVASEMVAELDLTDQDVTKIAEMIDAAILALVPEWRPGVAVDETCGDGEGLIEDGNVDHYSVFDPLASILSEGPQDFTSPSFSEILASEAVACSLIDGTAYGRFEEVTYQCHRPERLGTADEECTVSSESSIDMHGNESWPLTDGCKRPASPSLSALCCENESPPRCAGVIDQATENSMVDYMGCNEPMEHDQDGGFVMWNVDDEAGGDELAAQELRELKLRHEEEMRDLQRKHEEALMDFKTRWQQQKKVSSLSVSHGSRQDEYCVCPCSPGIDVSDANLVSVDAATFVALATTMASLDDPSFSQLENINITNKAEIVQGVSSMIGGLSTLIASEPLSFPSFSEGQDCKLLTLQTQNRSESDGRALCLAIQAQAVEQVV